jgi:hypothetical protein
MSDVDVPQAASVAPRRQDNFATSTWGAALSTLAQTDMDVLLAEMETPGREITVVFNTEPLAKPYVHNGSGTLNARVALKTGTALYTGITALAKLEDDDFLVSDSFGPCVPVIVFHGEDTWLAHANGTGGVVHHLKGQPALKAGQVVIISKALHAKQQMVATEIGRLLVEDGFDVRIVDIATAATIAVIVGPLSKRILVYFESAV